MYRNAALFFSATFMLVLGCERENFDIGARRGPLPGSPQYAAVSSVTAAPGLTYIEDVLPKKTGGAIDASALFVKNCSACHQATGLGIPGAFPPLDGSPYVLSDKTDRMASIMLYGLMGPIKVKGTQYVNVMAALGGSMSDEELAAVATYVRSSWSNKAGPLQPIVFADMRKKWGTRGPLNIQELGEEE